MLTEFNSLNTATFVQLVIKKLACSGLACCSATYYKMEKVVMFCICICGILLAFRIIRFKTRFFCNVTGIVFAFFLISLSPTRKHRSYLLGSKIALHQDWIVLGHQISLWSFEILPSQHFFYILLFSCYRQPKWWSLPLLRNLLCSKELGI